ncbi:hypothetical protein VTJ04DRAFT_9453 [Mycothermus thermophilus]|uniref:uncharacterized protein n=1 Tax=Humicola insolens TaxID=85995 RepID=UPI003743041E
MLEHKNSTESFRNKFSKVEVSEDVFGIPLSFNPRHQHHYQTKYSHPTRPELREEQGRAKASSLTVYMVFLPVLH